MISSFGKEIDKSSTGVVSIYATGIMDTIISSNSSVPEYDDDIYDEYKLLSIIFQESVGVQRSLLMNYLILMIVVKLVLTVVVILTTRILSLLYLVQINMLNALTTLGIFILTLIVRERYGVQPVLSQLKVRMT